MDVDNTINHIASSLSTQTDRQTLTLTYIHINVKTAHRDIWTTGDKVKKKIIKRHVEVSLFH